METLDCDTDTGMSITQRQQYRLECGCGWVGVVISSPDIYDDSNRPEVKRSIVAFILQHLRSCSHGGGGEEK